MKNLKKLIAVLVTLMCVLVLCACGEQDTSPLTDEEISNLYSSADEYKGRTFEFTAQVFNMEKDGDALYIQAWHDIKNYEENTIIEYSGGDVKVNTDDYIKVSGTVDGAFEGENAFGGEVEGVRIIADSLEKITAVEAIPAEKVIDVNKTVTKGNYVATLEKVDFTVDETRVYVKIENNSSDTFDVYPDQGVILQCGKQYEVTYNFDYGEISTEIRPGVSSEGIITFDRIDESSFTYLFTGYDNDYNDLEFEFKVKVK